MHIHFLLLFCPGENKENMSVFLKIKKDDPEMTWRNNRSFFSWTLGNSIALVDFPPSQVKPQLLASGGLG